MMPNSIEQPFIRIENLTKFFKGKEAIKQLSLNLPEKRIISIVGPDGSGKTTLLRLLTGLLLPSSGSVAINGYNTLHEAHLIHDLIGYMPQKFGLYEDLTMQQNLTLYSDLYGLSDAEKKEKWAHLLKMTDLTPFTERLVGNLSGGMKQKLGLICTLLKKPRLLLLDEPSVGVDPVSRRAIWDMVKQLVGDDISVLWTTTYLDEAARADHVVVLNEGTLIYDGSPQEFIQQSQTKNFESAFIEKLGGYQKIPHLLGENLEVIENVQDPIIEVKQVTHRFGEFIALKNISFSIHPGEIFGLLGPNGAGKSTLFKILCGLLNPSEGATEVDGISPQLTPAEARAHLGYMAQKFSLYEGLSVFQNLEFFSGVYGLENAKQLKAIEEMVSLFSLQEYLNTPALKLPLGFKQRLSLACAVMHHPKVLFLDEPTSGVDPVTRHQFWEHIHSLVAKNVTVVITTHFMDEAELCDRIALVHQGHLMALDTPEQLKNQVRSPHIPEPTLEDVFVQLTLGSHAV